VKINNFHGAKSYFVESGYIQNLDSSRLKFNVTRMADFDADSLFLKTSYDVSKDSLSIYGMESKKGILMRPEDAFLSSFLRKCSCNKKAFEVVLEIKKVHPLKRN